MKSDTAIVFAEKPELEMPRYLLVLIFLIFTLAGSMLDSWHESNQEPQVKVNHD